MQKIRKNQWEVSEIFKDGLTDGRTNRLTDKGDYHGPHLVNPRSKKTAIVLGWIATQELSAERTERGAGNQTH